MTNHATLIAELARLREAARKAEKTLDDIARGMITGAHNKAMMDKAMAGDIAGGRGELLDWMQETAASALTRLRESLKGAGDER